MNIFQAIQDGTFSDKSNWVLMTPKRSNPTIVSVRNGRWYDPKTWDIGRCPTKDDVVELRHKVEVGKTAVIRFKKLQVNNGGFLNQQQSGVEGQKYLHALGTIVAEGSLVIKIA